MANASASAPATRAQLDLILRHLATAPPAPLPTAPRGSIRLLLAAIQTFVLTTIVLTPLVAASLLALPVAWRMLTGTRMGSLSLPLWIAAVALLVAWVRALRAKDTKRSCLIEFGRDAYPELFRLLDGIAERVGTPRVALVTMSPGDGFAVSEERSGWSSRNGDLHLRLDWNDLNAMTLTEVTSILLHEFAHYGIGHTEESRRLYRRARFLFAFQERLASDTWTRWNPLLWWTRGFVRWFDRRYARISRVEEAQADEVAVRVVGAAAFVSGLEKAYRNGTETSGRMRGLIEAALERCDLDADVLGQMAEEPLEGRDREAFEAHLQERLRESLRDDDTHPPFADRGAAAEALAAAGAVAPGADRLPDSGAAYPFLFDWDALRRHQSRAVVEGAARRRHTAVGLRGDIEVPALDLGKPTWFAPRYHVAVRIVTMLFAGLGALLTAAITVLAYDDPARFGENWPVLALMALAQVYVVVAAFRARRSGLLGGAEGLEWRRAFSTMRFGWDAVDAIRWDDRGPVVHCGSTRIRIGGQPSDHDAMNDLILESAPALQVLGWGTGLQRVPAPPPEAAWPTRIREESKDILIEGPGQNRLRIREDHVMSGRIREAIEERLLPRLYG